MTLPLPTAPPPKLDTVLDIAARWRAGGRPVALATVVDTWGSAPRPAGSHLVIDADGLFEGSVSGGCVEGAVVAEAMEVIETGQPRLLDFGVADETAWRVGLSCGGKISVFVQRLGDGLSDDDLLRLTAASAARRAARTRTDLASGQTEVLVEGDPGWAAADDGGVARRVDSRFVNLYRPSPRIVIIGAVHIAQALLPMAAVAGFAVTIIDPRTAFATPERFAGADLVAEWPDEALERRPLDRHSALVAVTHDPKIDDPALRAALAANCFYIGALGSRKTHAARMERLQAAGVLQETLAAIHAPIGLAIGAATPSEIAVSILAEIIRTLRLPAAARTPGLAA